MSSEERYSVDHDRTEFPAELQKLYNAAPGTIYCEIIRGYTNIRTNERICHVCFSLDEEIIRSNFHSFFIHKISTRNTTTFRCNNCKYNIKYLQNISRCRACVSILSSIVTSR